MIPKWVRKQFTKNHPEVLEVRCLDLMDLRDMNDGVNFIVINELRFVIVIDLKDGSKRPARFEFSIKPGFFTDLASVDSIPLVKIKKLTPGNRMFVLHDFGYQKNLFGWSQRTWDDVMLVGLRWDESGNGLAWRRWAGVRIGGRKTWNKYRGR